MWTPQVMAGMVLASCGGCVVGLVLVGVIRRTGHVAENYRGRRVVCPAGVILPIAVSAGLLTTLGIPHGTRQDPALFTGVVWGFALLGLIDDFFGDRSVRGFRGHLRALAAGRVSTGLIKAVGGLVVGLAAGLRIGLGPAVAVLAAVVIALAANIFNLLDLRPGRTLKAFTLATLVIFALSRSGLSWTLWPALIPPVALLFMLDLGEYAMLGDTGANVLGAMIGLAVVVNFGWQVQLAAAILLAAATVASEKHSFSEAIERVSVLSWLDMLGRRSPADVTGGKRTG